MKLPRLTELLALALLGGLAKRLAKAFPVDYRAYIRSERWKRKASAIRHRDNYTCQDCGMGGYEVHHKTYVRLGYELAIDLVTLCRSCHQARHDRNEL